MKDTEDFPVIIAARLSRKKKDARGEPGIETQDEHSREWCETQGLRVIAMVADYKSGRVAPWHRKNLKPWVTRPELMQLYKGIVAYKNDRLSRGDWEDESEIRKWASKHGKRLMIVNGPQWPPRHEGDRWQWEASAMQSNKEWEEIRERSMRAQKQLRNEGKLVGRVPWGYEIIGKKYDRMPVVTEEGKRYIPQVFQRIAEGQTCHKVAEWLGAGPRPGITPRTIQRMIRNRFYTGTRLNTKGQPQLLKIPPLVDAKLWRQANNRLDNGKRGKRGPANGAPALLTSVLFCARCHSPMYRIHPPGRGYWYRCNGHSPANKGCGNNVHLETTDAHVIILLSQSDELWPDWQKIEGENHDIELAQIKLELRDLAAKDLPDDEYDAELARLRAERDRIAALPNTPDRWEKTYSGETIGEHFGSLDYAGKRAMLLDEVNTVRIYAQSITDPELRKITPGPMLRIESRLFKLPVTWLSEQ